MPLSNYRELLPILIDNLKGCNQDRIPIQALKDAGREFCRRSRAWIEELDPVNIVANQQTYDLDPVIAWDATIICVKWLKIQGTTADPVPTSYFTVPTDTTIKLHESITPDTALTDGLIAKVVLMPRLGSIEIAEWFLEKNAEAIIGRAMYMLLSSKGKPWYNPELALRYQMDFRKGVCSAVAETTRGMKHGPDYVYG